MSYAYVKSAKDTQDAVFHLFFRKSPFAGGFTVCCGLADLVQYVEHFRFTKEDLDYLATLRGNDGRVLFDEAFLRYLESMPFALDIDAIPEGTVVFPQEPLVRVKGPIVACQLLESVLLNIINYQTLIATKAARVLLATGGEPVMEFGLRRAQGVDGALSAARASYIGGCQGTSNVLAGKLYGIPVKGTHAHSWVMCFESELESFEAYADAMPNNCVFLVDTYNTLEGVRHAVEVGKKLRQKGFELAGIRLDSGDLAYLSIEARKILDEGGFASASIVASNDLDEHIIESLKVQGAKVNVWGVGTKLVTAFDEPALGGVYKLAALRAPGGDWQDRVKVSEQAIKTSTPGILQVRRFMGSQYWIADAIVDEREPKQGKITIIDPKDPTRRKHLGPETPSEELLVPVFRQGKLVYSCPSIEQSRARVKEQLSRLHPTIKRFVNPHEYPVGLESNVYQRKTDLILRMRGG